MIFHLEIQLLHHLHLDPALGSAAGIQGVLITQVSKHTHTHTLYIFGLNLYILQYMYSWAIIIIKQKDRKSVV